MVISAQTAPPSPPAPGPDVAERTVGDLTVLPRPTPPPTPAADPAPAPAAPVAPVARKADPLAGSRILVVSTEGPGCPAGVTRHTQGLVDHLLARGADVRRVGETRPLARTPDLQLFALTGGHLPDLVLAVTPGRNGAAAAVRTARRAGVPAVLVVHDLLHGRDPIGPSGRTSPRSMGIPTGGLALPRLTAVAESALLRGAGEVAVVSPDLAAAVRARGVPRERVHLLPHWVPSSAVQDNRIRLRAELGWPVAPFTVVQAGALGTSTDPVTLVETARRLPADVHLVVMGASRAERRALSRAGADAVPTLRVLDRLAPGGLGPVLAAADLLLVCTRAEADAAHAAVDGGPLPPGIGAYLGAGRPVLAAVPGQGVIATELERSGGAGLVVRPADPGLLARAVLALRDDPQLRTRMGECGREYAQRRLDRLEVMRRFDALLQSAMVGCGPARRR